MNVNHWRESVWDSDLHMTEKIVALCYADHTSDGMSVWVYEPRGAERCGMGASTFRKKRQALVCKGWLVLVAEGRRGPNPIAATYDLALPNNAPSERIWGAATANNAPSEQRNALSDSPSPTSSPTSPKARACAKCQQRRARVDSLCVVCTARRDQA